MKFLLILTLISMTNAFAQNEAASNKINEVLNNPQFQEGKCPAKCQSDQMDCYNKADASKRDQCTNTFNTCVANCDGEIGKIVNPETLSNPSTILNSLNMDPKLIKQVVNAQEGKEVTPINPSSAGAETNATTTPASNPAISPVGAPPPATSTNLEDAFK